MNQSAFEVIYKHITEKCDKLGASARNPTIINDWIASGYDTEKDIIPAIDWLLKVSPPSSITSFYRFTGPIRKFHMRRIQEQSKPKELTAQERLSGLARTWAWTRQNNPDQYEVGWVSLSGRDVRAKKFLEQYEQEHGRVEI